MNRVSVKPFKAIITIGLQVGYTDKLISKAEIVGAIQSYQNSLIKDKSIYLSVALSECDIVLSGQLEPHLQLSIINYPKFPNHISILKKEVENLTTFLMDKYNQNRVVIEYLNDETVMLEKSKEIDLRINSL
ncbi:hypothetical protein CLV90_2049 [Maribacter spongiicola]|uniref:Uncharacterized protein n=1 Tax=Maribacter spongiicola TaxID=1206753 RepID=A0A4R7K288_9FLAO|nr:hypothetical protein [Maribacter spongiicola]TDT44970.1 hypothetical protein CLV90_2049 [Maribacter spongiicola]